MLATTKNRLECFCVRKPLLAVFGLDAKREPYVHVKVYKQRRIYAEFIARGGQVDISCRECFRWHRVVFRSTSEATLEEVQVPLEVRIQEGLHDSASVG